MNRWLIGLVGVLVLAWIAVLWVPEVWGSENFAPDVVSISAPAARATSSGVEPGRVTVGAVPAAGHSEPEPVGQRTLRIVSARTGVGLASAVLRIKRVAPPRSSSRQVTATEFAAARRERETSDTAPVETPLRFAAGRDGVVTALLPQSLLASEHVECAVSCAGHVGLRVRGRLPAEGQAIELQPAAGLKVVARDAKGRPVAGLRVGLLPPALAGGAFRGSWGSDLDKSFPEGFKAPGWRAGSRGWRMDPGSFLFRGRRVDREHLGVPASQWRAVTSASGEAEFEGLPAGQGYRLVLRNPTPAKMVPAHENVFLVEKKAHVQVGSKPVPGMSGRFDLRVGEVAQVGVETIACGVLRGRVIASDPSIPPQVKLYAVRRARAENGKTVTSLDMAALVVADPAGDFEFSGVPVGEYVVRAWWRCGPEDLFFAAVGAKVNGSEPEDLGTLRAIQGARLRVAVDLRDDRGAPLDPANLLPENQRFAFLVVEVLPDSRNAADAIYEVVTVGLGRHYNLHGLRPGDLKLRPAAPPWPSVVEIGSPAAQYHLLSSHQPTREERVGASTAARLGLSVRVLRKRSLELLFPAGVSPGGLEVWALRRGGVAQRLKPGELAATGSRSRTLELAWPLDAESLFVHSNGMTAEGAGVFGRLDLRDVRGVVPQLELSRGGSIDGRLQGPGGAPRREVVLQWSLRGWQAGGQRGFPFRAQTDRDGRFLLTGVPPGVELVPERPEWRVPVASVGGRAKVSLRALR